MRLAAAFPRDHVTDSTITLYHSKLSSCDEEAVTEAIESAIESATKFPTIAELREAVRQTVQRTPEYVPALPIARAPMPESLKQQIAEMNRKFDERSAELNA